MGDDDCEPFSVNQYQVANLLGSGAYGDVRLATNEKGVKFAVKCLSRSFLKKQRDFVKNGGGRPKIKTALEDVQREIAIMKKTHHPNLVRMIEAIDDESEDQMYIVLEFVNGGQCMYFNAKTKSYECKGGGVYDEPRTRELFRDLVVGLRYLHAQNIIHRDLKPDNLLLETEGGRLKLADFGIAQKLEVDGTKSMNITHMQGTHQFMSPEMITENMYNGFKVDVWAAGVCLYTFCHGRLPFWGNTLEEVFDSITNDKMTLDDKLSDSMKSVLTKILEKDPATRLVLEQIIADPYFEFENVEGEIQALELTEEEKANAFTPRLTFLQVASLKVKMDRWRNAANSKRDVATSSVSSDNPLVEDIKPAKDVNLEVAPPTAPKAPEAVQATQPLKVAVKTNPESEPTNASCCLFM